MRTENILALKQRFPEIRKQYKKMEDEGYQSEVKVEEARKCGLTASLNGSYIHSRYNPEREAEKLIQQHEEELKNYNNVFFYGIGLGYHVEKMIECFPDKKVTLYEPSVDMFYQASLHRDLDFLNNRNVDSLFVEFNEEDSSFFINQYMARFKDRTLIISLPGITKVFNEQAKRFYELWKQTTANQQSALKANVAYQKRWVLNSLINLPYVLETPNILADVNREHFKDKTAFIIGAGPSLDYDIGALKKIKEEREAYIFAIGSSINALVAHDIYPDAVFSYDPSHLNPKVFEKVVSNGHDEKIPLVFGSSITTEVLRMYNGPKFHMITSQDTTGRHVLQYNSSEQVEFINDAPSIAALTVSVLAKLGFANIVFSGQNLSYSNSSRYASSIEYSHIDNNVSNYEGSRLPSTINVNNEKVYTTQGFISTKKQIEHYISLFPHIKFQNTTVDGALIQGAPYVPIESLSNDIFSEISHGTFDKAEANDYDKKALENHLIKIEESADMLKTELEKGIQTLQKLKTNMENKDEVEMQKQFTELDEAIGNMKNNTFYNLYVGPTNRVHYDLLTRKNKEIKYEEDYHKKAEIVLNEYGNYLKNCIDDFGRFDLVFKDIKSKIYEEIKSQVKE